MWSVLATLGVIAATVLAGLVADRRWGVLGVLPRTDRLLAATAPRALPAHGPGEAPASALTVSPDELEQLRREQRCACTSPMDAVADAEVTYDGRTLLVLRFACARCASARRIYVAPG
jgi:hypothetical protein